jgi:hypothetical protein
MGIMTVRANYLFFVLMIGYVGHIFAAMAQITQVRLRGLLKMHIPALMGIMAKYAIPDHYRPMQRITGNLKSRMAGIT